MSASAEQVHIARYRVFQAGRRDGEIQRAGFVHALDEPMQKAGRECIAAADAIDPQCQPAGARGCSIHERESPGGRAVPGYPHRQRGRTVVAIHCSRGKAENATCEAARKRSSSADCVKSSPSTSAMSRSLPNSRSASAITWRSSCAACVARVPQRLLR